VPSIVIRDVATSTSGRLPVATPNTATRSYPLVMIPAFAVPLSLLLHALSLRQLQRSARREGPGVAALSSGTTRAPGSAGGA